MLNYLFSKSQKVISYFYRIDDFHPKIDRAPGKLIRLGTNYGGWYFLDRDGLYGSTVVCIGAGEDISFDLEFIVKYNSRVIIVDPTPRSIDHLNAVFARIGLAPTVSCTSDGNQPPASYDLSKIDREQICFLDKAVWVTEGEVRFFKPKNEVSVSHSIVNFQNEYNTSPQLPHIVVQTTTMTKLFEDFGLMETPLLKMDIEGAELKVLPQMFKENIFPEQILVEFDGLANRNSKDYSNYTKQDKLMRKYGYVCLKFDPPSNLLYWRAFK